MATKDKHIDEYIAKAQPFAQPILRHIRELVHKAFPDIEETMKWSFPHFEFQGVVCSMAAFKAHCAFGFWKAELFPDDLKSKLEIKDREAMGHAGRISSLKDLPDDKTIIACIKEAVRLNKENIKRERKPVVNAPAEVPDYFLKEISKNKKALKNFTTLNNSHKKEYVEWIGEAKTEATRNKRMQTAIEWLTEGKSRNWKYERK